MKKLVLVLTLAAFALAGTAFAQDPNWSDNIGVYTDEAATENCATLGFLQEAPAFLVLTKVTSPAIAGWEAKIVLENVLLLDGIELRYDSINAGSRADEYIVGFGAPVPVVGGTLVLADMTIKAINADPGNIFIDHVYFHVADDPVPAYQDGAGDIFEIHPSTIDGHEGGPVFFLNNGCDPVAVDEDTWGGVKSLYR